MKQRIEQIHDSFFNHVAQDEDRETIMRRGEMNKNAADEPAAKGSSIRIERVELEPSKKYAFKTPEGTFDFVVLSGGILEGDGLNGSVQAGKVIFTAGTNEYEGYFSS